MNEIAETFAAAGLPDGFHRAAAEIYRRTPHARTDAYDSLERVLSALGTKADGRVAGPGPVRRFQSL
jgi:hypothetical protein